MRREVRASDGRAWVVRTYRFERPPWRTVGLGLGLFDPDEGVFVYLPLVFVAVLLAPLTLVLLPLLIFFGEAGSRAVLALVANRYTVEAVHEGPPRSRMRWTTAGEHVGAVLEQVARQLELGYERIRPHRGEFVGFG
jgi:hypothetical protein